MRERGSPDHWSAAKASEQGDRSRFPMTPPSSGASALGRAVAPQVSSETGSGFGVQPAAQLTEPNQSENETPERLLALKKLSALLLDPPPKLRRVYSSWQFWAVVATVTTGGMAFFAVGLLFKLPAMPNCPSIFWPTASASVRLYCAQLAGNKQTVKDLLEAIALVKSLPQDHPLREEIDRQIEDWSVDILNLADKSFHAGNLKEAIATAKKIPNDVPAYKLVEERIKSWQSVWSKADEIYKAAEAQLRESNWIQAFRVAVRLQTVANDYWKTTKFDELSQVIQASREDSDKLAKARSLVQRGGTNNLQEAIKIAQSIGQKSYIYSAAQKFIPEIGRKMLELAETKVEERDLEGAIALARQIPANANMQAEVDDFINLAQAQSTAKEGTSASIEAAIAQAQKISAERPLHNKAQDLIKFWQRELEDIARLEKARQLAGLGTVNDLTAAIAQAQLVPTNNPRAQEARTEISRWTSQIQTMEDRPFLERAEQLAIIGDETSLQAAVYEASKIGRGRALYQEAQNKMGQWIGQIQRLQDQPYLEQARQLGREGNLSEAIAVAQQIQAGRALSGEAQSAIADWQAQMRSQQNWQEANRLATQGTPDALLGAIRSAQQVPRSSPLRAEAREAINQWSYQLLSMAQERASYDVQGAITIALQIPSGSGAYSDARAQIQSWQNSLNPPPTNPEPETTAPSNEQPSPPPEPTPQ
jgi:hypothetical protein